MKDLSRLFTLALILFTVMCILVGCGSTYTIRTKDSREFQAKNEPDITKDRYIKFKTISGEKVLLKQDEVSVISED